MLGKLFNLTGASAGGVYSHQSPAGEKPSPESIQEEIHTRSLLFPDTQALYHRDDQVFPLPAASAFQPRAEVDDYDYEGDIDIDTGDVRVIIMQDTLGSVNPSLLFDSQPAPPPDRPAPPTNSSSQRVVPDARKASSSSRKSSVGQSSRPLVVQPGSPPPRHGAFDRRGSIQSRAYSVVETEAQRAAKIYREELASFSSCIFANTEVMAYKGTSTKVHIIPSDSRSSTVPGSFMGDGRGSMGRSSMRSSRLAQSFTSEAPVPNTASSSGPGRQADRNKVLVTRLFPVNLPSDDPDTPQGRAEDQGGFPFPYSPDESGPKKKKPRPVPKRTPMYAVALVLQLPPNPSHVGGNAPKPAFRASSSYNEPDNFPSSFGSARRSGWTMVGSDSFESAYSNEVEDRMDVVTQHWDIIMRALTHLQSVVASTLFPMLKQADISAPNPHPANVPIQIARTSSVHSRRGSDASQMKQPKQSAKLVALPPNALMIDGRIHQEVEEAKLRIVTGLRATRVVTGQGRWGPWREEARWVAKWAGGKEQGFFFFNLLTGFLATHTEWLQALSPVRYRKRFYQQLKAKHEDTSLPSRTIIVAKDKMAARRLIFLLSAFLPASQQMPPARLQRPVTSASFAGFGHSPPSYVVPMNKEESLRRKINRLHGHRGTSHTRSFSIQSQATTRSTTGIPEHLAHLSIDERRSSEMFRPANLPLAGSDRHTRKSSAATMNTVTPDAAVPHFSTVHRHSTHRSLRPESSGSIAADDLKRSLKRVDSLGHTSHGSTDSRSSRWGSVISGLWSIPKRRDSTTTASLDVPESQDSPLASPTVTSPTKAMAAKKGKLAAVVQEVQGQSTPARGHFGQGDTPGDEPNTPRRMDVKQSRIPDPSGAYESPVKTSINDDDGVIDVDTAVSSPSSSGYLSTPGLGSVDGDMPLNVAGWLERYHPDFTLQAIPPRKHLLDQILHPNTFATEWPVEQWVDVSSAIVADTTTFTIRRLKYRRLVKPRLMMSERTPGSHLSPHGAALMTPSISPYEQPIEEKFEEEDLVTLDDALIDAIERVIAQSSDASKVTSASSSRSVSKRREQRRGSVASEPQPPPPEEQQQQQQIDPSDLRRLDFQEVPRAECKTVVLSALEGIVQEVVDQRDREGGGGGGGGGDAGHHADHRNVATYELSREKESALRGAIRNWLETVELNDR
ncbi:folliculin-interacting protein N-terminus-domain-containing protein [Xylariaceae sp. FL0804]|nr:folliculin-interacting protein N-terminus-domain-containing protein [Xylariaceae sp. FL0804]